MGASPNGSPHSVLDDAARRTEMVLEDVLSRGVFVESLPELRTAIREEINALRSARALADKRADLSEPEMGGTTLDLTLEEARLVRAALHHLAALYDGSMRHAEASAALKLRKQINAGVSRNAERRTGGAA